MVALSSLHFRWLQYFRSYVYYMKYRNAVHFRRWYRMEWSVLIECVIVYAMFPKGNLNGTKKTGSFWSYEKQLKLKFATQWRTISNLSSHKVIFYHTVSQVIRKHNSLSLSLSLSPLFLSIRNYSLSPVLSALMFSNVFYMFFSTKQLGSYTYALEKDQWTSEYWKYSAWILIAIE